MAEALARATLAKKLNVTPDELEKKGIIIISAGMEAIEEAHKAGVCSVARKPLHISDLVGRIEACCQTQGQQLDA